MNDIQNMNLFISALHSKSCITVNAFCLQHDLTYVVFHQMLDDVYAAYIADKHHAINKEEKHGTGITASDTTAENGRNR